MDNQGEIKNVIINQLEEINNFLNTLIRGLDLDGFRLDDILNLLEDKIILNSNIIKDITIQKLFLQIYTIIKKNDKTNNESNIISIKKLQKIINNKIRDLN